MRCCLAAALQEHREAALFVALVEGACANHRRKPVGQSLLRDFTAIGAAIDEPGECIKQCSNEVDRLRFLVQRAESKAMPALWQLRLAVMQLSAELAEWAVG